LAGHTTVWLNDALATEKDSKHYPLAYALLS